MRGCVCVSAWVLKQWVCIGVGQWVVVAMGFSWMAKARTSKGFFLVAAIEMPL